MSIQEQLTGDLKDAMKSGDTLTKDTVRLIRAAIQNAEMKKGEHLLDEFRKTHTYNNNKDTETPLLPKITTTEMALGDTEVNDLLTKMAKQYRDSITTYREGGREDLASSEQRELDVLLRYLPEQMSTSAIREIATRVAEEVGATGPGDKGKLMGKLMPLVKGKADGSEVNSVVTELLASFSL